MPKLRDIMTKQVITVGPELTIREAVDVLTRHHVSGAPVVAGGHVVGVVSATDLLVALSSIPAEPAEVPPVADPESPVDASPLSAWDEEGEPPATYFAELWRDANAAAEDRHERPETAYQNALDELTVGDVMTHNVCSLPSNAAVATAAAHMRQRAIHRILVIDGRELRGIVSALDIARAVADPSLLRRKSQPIA